MLILHCQNFEKIFGVYKDNFLSYLILCVKYYIYICKFQTKTPTLLTVLFLLKVKGIQNMSLHRREVNSQPIFKKWRFDL